MQKLVRCKVCGYILSENKLGDVCPACGAKRAAFEPFVPNMSETRFKKLRMDLHPVMVHFPQALPVAVVLLLLLSLIPDVTWAGYFFLTVKVISIFIPFVAVFAILTGVFDGKTRFKRITPLLKRKIAIGTIYLILAAINAITLWVISDLAVIWWVGLILAFGCVGCSMALGKIGASLNCAYLPNGQK